MPRLFIEAGSPIRRSPAKLARQLTEAYRSLATSFIGFQRLGIHRAPVVALTTNPLPPQRGVVIPQVTLYSSVNVHPGFPPGFPAETTVRRGSPSGSCATRGKAGLMPAGLQAPDPIYSPFYSVVKGRCPASYTPFPCRPAVRWWSRGDSNPRLPPCKGGALPTELRPHCRPLGGGRWWTRTTDLGLIRTAL